MQHKPHPLRADALLEGKIRLGRRFPNFLAEIPLRSARRDLGSQVAGQQHGTGKGRESLWPMPGFLEKISKFIP